MKTCARHGYVVAASDVVPTDPSDLGVELLPVVGCSQLQCESCGAQVKNLVGVRFKDDRQPDLDTAYDNPSAFVEPGVAAWRLYLCRCSSWTETHHHPLYDPDPDPYRDPTMAWRCSGHPAITLPRDVDGASLAGEPELRDVAARVLHGWHPPGGRPGDAVRVAWLRRLHSRLEDSWASRLANAVVDHIGDPDPEVRARVLVFCKNVTDDALLGRLALWLDGDRRLFSQIPDRVSSISDETLEDSLWRAVAPLVTRSSRTRQLARSASRTPGRGGPGLFDTLATCDTAWFVANIGPIVRANRDHIEVLSDALERLENAEANEGARAAMADKLPRARTMQEMLFAISLEPCPTCGARVGPVEPRGNDDAWALTGTCPDCRTIRTFQFNTEGNPRSQMHERLELGDGRPSAVIEPAKLIAELERLAPALHDDPRGLGPAEWSEHTITAERAYTAAVELAKFLPSGGGNPPDLAAPHDRAWIVREHDRAVTRLDRIVADAPRVWALRNGGILHVTEEIRGLLNQQGKLVRPTIADLQAYLAPRAKTVTKRPADVFVELDSPGLKAVRLWEDALGAHADVHLTAPEADVNEAVRGSAVPVDVHRDGSHVQRLTVHFPR